MGVKETEETEFLGMDFVAEVARISRDFYKKIVRPNWEFKGHPSSVVSGQQVDDLWSSFRV